MLEIKGNDITLTRGDSLNLKIVILKNRISSKLPNGREKLTPEELQEMGASIYFNMSRYYPGQLNYELLIDNKEIPLETMALRLDPSDTKNIPLGIYNYDISLHYQQEEVEEEKVDTFLHGTFQLVGECNGVADRVWENSI